MISANLPAWAGFLLALLGPVSGLTAPDPVKVDPVKPVISGELKKWHV